MEQIFIGTHVLWVDVTTVQDVQNTNMTEQLKKCWDLESIGIRGDESSVYDKFAEEVRFNGERYEEKLPVKEHLENLSIKKEKEEQAERQRLEVEATMREKNENNGNRKKLKRSKRWKR